MVLTMMFQQHFLSILSLSEAQALANALAVVNPKKMAYEQLDEAIKKFPQQRMVLQKERDSYVPHGQLVIVKDFTNKSNPLRLAYKFDVYAAEPLFRANIYVDALDGHILLKDMIIKHTDGTAQTRYAGTRQIKTKQVTAGLTGATDPGNGLLPYTWTGTPLRTPISNSSFYILHDDTRGGGVMTFDLNGVGGAPISVPGVYNQATSFTDPDNIWNDGDATLTMIINAELMLVVHRPAVLVKQKMMMLHSMHTGAQKWCMITGRMYTTV
jgi:hypothetical protein